MTIATEGSTRIVANVCGDAAGSAAADVTAGGRAGRLVPVLDDPLQLLARDALRERLPVLVRETCAWAVGLSDRQHFVLRHGRTVPSGVTLGLRAAAGQQLSVDEDGRIDLAEAPAGSFQDALNALLPDGGVIADRFDLEVLDPFVLETCVTAAARAADVDPVAWADLLDDLGEDGSDLAAVTRAAEWDIPLRIEAEHLLLAALGRVPLVEVEAEGLPLSLVRAAEAQLRDTGSVGAPSAPAGEELAGALFLAERALAEAQLPTPVPPEQAGRLIDLLDGIGIQPDETLLLLPHLPVQEETAELVAREVDGLR